MPVASPTPPARPVPPRRPRRTARRLPLLGVLLALVLVGCGPAGSAQLVTPLEDSGAPAASEALTTLDSLEVKGRAPSTGYGRDRFGPTWEDVDGNGCSTRNDILARDLTEVQTQDDGCRVSSGILHDPYTDTRIDFTAGVDTSAEVQIDHVVALSDAWQKGAQQLDEQQRLALANDPLNLLAVDGPTNQSKSDGDAATWLPPNRGYWCPYVSRQVEVKAKYDLWVTPPEHDRMENVLEGCGEGSAQEPSSSPSPEPEATTASYASCKAARQAGAAPLHRGSPGYASRLDGDGDGVACES